MLGLLAVVGVAAVTAAQQDETDMSPASVRRAEMLILARCAVCHTPDLIAQQRLSPDRWTATVEKMVQWGAQLTPDETDELISYLSRRYAPDAPANLSPIGEAFMQVRPFMEDPAASGPVIGVATRGAGIYASNCLACHGEEARGLVGPKLVKSPILKNEGAFWETVLHGRGAMPGWGQALSDQQIADVYAWLRALP